MLAYISILVGLQFVRPRPPAPQLAPEEVAQVAESYTGQYLVPYLRETMARGKKRRA